MRALTSGHCEGHVLGLLPKTPPRELQPLLLCPPEPPLEFLLP